MVADAIGDAPFASGAAPAAWMVFKVEEARRAAIAVAVEIEAVEVVDIESPSAEADLQVYFGIKLGECPIGCTYVPPHIGVKASVVNGGVKLHARAAAV